MGDNIIQMDASRMAELVANGELSPVEVIRVHLDRIAAVDADRATPFSAMRAYAGRVRVEAEDRFVITVDLAWDPGWTGEQIRFSPWRATD
jgi:aspartyl-tRNA(Asn)/glutamyl-tRNA(Gln) amidotransferase subunit A